MRASEERLADIAECCELIGESATHVEPELRAKYPEIDWAGIKAFRNILVHEYFGVEWDRVWLVAFEEIPKLLKQIREILSREFGQRPV
jgi:uncharacterized protein with HEPN domain